METPQKHYYIPTVIEKSGGTEHAYDIYSRLLLDRVIFIGTEIDDSVANSMVAHLMFLQMVDPKKDIHLYIDSPGGVGRRLDRTNRYAREEARRALFCG